MADDDDLKRRAFAAYFRAGAIDQPSNKSGVVIVGGLKYVHLFSGSKTYAVYRVDNAGRLKRLRRPPKELTTGNF